MPEHGSLPPSNYLAACSIKEGIELDGKVIKLQVWDFAGHERSLSSNQIGDAHGIFVVYDVTNTDTFARCVAWRPGRTRHVFC